MLKKQVQKIVLIFIAFFSVFLFYSNTAFASDSVEFRYGANGVQNPTGFELVDAGFDENGLFFDFSYSGSYSSELYSNYDSEWNVSTFYFPAFYDQWAWYRGLKLKDSISGQTLNINEFECLSSKKSYLNNDSMIEKAWCSLNETGSLRVYAKSIRYPYSEYGSQLSASDGYAFSESELDSLIPNFFNSDGLTSLELNSNFLNISGNYVTDRDSWFSNYPYGANISSLITPQSINGVCGDANGSTFDYANFNTQDFCSAGDFYLSGDSGERIIYACVGLNGGTTQYNCHADYYHNLEPVITDVIDFDFDNFTYDFEEEEVSKNWLIDVFKFLFLPREETIQKFFTTFDNFKQKIPFGYIHLIQNKFKEVSLESTEEFALNLELLGEDYEVFSVTSLKEQIGENTFNVYYNIMKALIWFTLVLYLVTRSRKLFDNDD